MNDPIVLIPDAPTSEDVGQKTSTPVANEKPSAATSTADGILLYTVTALCSVAAAVILLICEPTSTCITALLGSHPAKHSAIYIDAPTSAIELFKLASELSRTDILFFLAALISPIFVCRRTYLSLLVILRCSILTLAAGLVVMSESPGFAKTAVTAICAVTAAAFVYSASSSPKLSCGADGLCSFTKYSSKLLCALGAVVLLRSVFLILGAYIF